MPINLQGSGNIAEGWGPMPKLDAPNIGGVLGEILQQRRWQQAQTQKNIADTIKHIQSQREEQAYTDALQKAGLLPEGDYGGLGIKGGASLATMIQRKQALDALAAHRTAMEARIGRGRGGGGSGDTDTQVEAPEDYYGLHNAPGIPTTKTINGIVHIQDTHGRWKPGPKWMQTQASGQSGGGISQADLSKAIKEQGGLLETKNTLDERKAKQEAEDIKALRPNVPFKQSDEYNRTVNRLKQLQEIPGMPSTAPADTGRPIASDKAGGHADTYGVPPTGKPTAEHIQMLRDNPSENMKAYFNEVYGPGAADKYL